MQSVSDFVLTFTSPGIGNTLSSHKEAQTADKVARFFVAELFGVLDRELLIYYADDVVLRLVDEEVIAREGVKRK